MIGDSDIRAIQDCIGNSITDTLTGNRRFAGVIGENPSLYSRSPALWNAAFAMLGLDATYLPFDVARNRLGQLISILRDSERLIGFNVTVPHKVAIMDYLDGLDSGAARIQAVNTVVRTSAARLVGYNTDGLGFIESILKPQPGQSQSFIPSLDELEVLLIGAGGSARAVAFHIADRLTRGRILICNRTLDRAVSLAKEIGKNAQAIAEQELSYWAVRAALVINSSTKGQGGARELSNGNVTSFEPYSALAAAHPVAVPRSDFTKHSAEESLANPSYADALHNNENSLTLARRIPKSVAFYDLIYFPEETVFLRHARITGHRTMNGKGMIICQAARALFDHLCQQELRARGLHTVAIYNRIVETMYGAW
ncbi:MAG: shikimate dehydrogenase family protein [Alphaproteobacteria bacterium]